MSTATERTAARKRAATREYEAAADKLRTLCPPGTTVYCVLRHRSRSGMSRVIDPFILVPNDYGRTAGAVRPFYLRGWMADIGLGRIDRTHDGLVVNGCGMDMGFHLVYSLSRILYGDGYGCTGEGCLSNDHSNGDRDYTPHGDNPRGDGLVRWHRDGGYALRCEWI